ncbi:hypothetical protein TCAL_01851 [Tigriopus californicus]|uniref:Small ribosomal subunit protein mS33 n=1 Tax=Tigriopus californicus TaxID=6832 RepID=A0A553ND17_TIGCA|nr:small ribosomal subunit protein mS33-like [Tigriopus californicus]TRY63340.1 hypothetical protein TCAL_01851 [Tigriopus californicus]|eukprot:TCALIF_01851-PA protein Name:"Similar to Mrps33 28S ribosomal protein S33, mitochondrial (Mus musculus)" AED:0.32 eAED:0.36 QI:0/-1/0/1/-1/1/1/0/113
MATRRFLEYTRNLHPDYLRRVKFLRDSIFGQVRRPTSKNSLRVVNMLARRPMQDRPELVRYYPAHDETQKLMTQLRDYGLFRNQHEDFKDEMERLRLLRGKPRKQWRRPWLEK